MEGTYVFLLMASQPSSKQYPLWMLSLGQSFQSSLNIFSFLKILANDRGQIFLLIRIWAPSFGALRALGWVSCFCRGTDLKCVSGTQMHRWRSPWTFLHTGRDFNHYDMHTCIHVYMHYSSPIWSWFLNFPFRWNKISYYNNSLTQFS